MAKDKKGKTDSKKAKLAEKKKKQEVKKTKSEKRKATKVDGSDAEDVDLDAVLEEYKKQQEQFLKITETVADGPPRARSAATFLANPSNSNQLLLFGGEYFNGSLATFFNDLMIYYVDRDEWRCVTSPNAPLPRSGHAWTRGGNQSNAVYLFGGEFSSPKQGTFYHYNDFWKLDPTSREWTRLEPKGKTPPARSGHRMTYFKNYIILFGGFQDTANQTKYLGDLWVYDTTNFVWHNPALPPAQLKPDPRSSFTLLPHDQGAVLYGGYSRVKTTAPTTNKQQQQPGRGPQGGGSGGGQRNVLRPLIHTDCFFLRITPPPSTDAPHSSSGSLPPTVRWERRKKPANAPNPTRAGTTMAFHKGRGLLFGGVHDVQESEEGIESEFFNGLFTWNVERNRFFSLALRKGRVPGGGKNTNRGGGGGGGRKGRARENEEELLRGLAALRAGAGVDDDDDDEEMEGMEMGEEKGEEKVAREMPVSMEFPHPRFNALLAVQDDVLYIYGGTFEKGEREFTFDDLYAIDLGKLDGCKEVFNRPVEDWIVSDDEDDEEDEDEEDDYEDEDDEDEEMADEETKEQMFTPSKRNKKQASDEVSNADSASTAPSTVSSEEDEEESVATTVDDGLPHPRPFESRRDFFQRTSNEWQEVLMASLRWKGIQPETLTIKEIKSRAFELSEEKWWDCREEITLLEEEQEAAGIGEVVSLADKGESGAHAGGGARRRYLFFCFFFSADTMPLGIQRLNAKRSQPNDRIVFIKPLKGPGHDIAQDFLERIAAQCCKCNLPIMREHHLSVMSLEEYEPNPEFVGRNFNAGEVIQLVLKARSGHWLPFNYVQMVMMHELAHCKQMNHSRAFWAVRNQYAEQMRVLWARGFSGEGIWGRGALLSTGEFEKNMVEPGELLPEHLCGGTYRSRGRKRKAKKTLTYKEQKERRILNKFGANGVALGQDVETKKKLEKGKTVAAKPRVAGSARGRELRAAAALARFDQQKTEETVKEEGSETESGHDYEEDDLASGPDAVDIDGKRLLDSKGGGMIKVCEDENPDNQDAQDELRELQSFETGKPVPKSPTLAPEKSLAKPAPKTTANKPATLVDKNSTKSKPPISTNTPPPQSSSWGSSVCPICTFANDSGSATCAMCANTLESEAMLDVWACKSKTCQGTKYRNAGDCSICGVCGERR
ncbi:kelch repeat-containing protein 3 [Chaetomidium leptoderma]|uniref:Kelch repeat-containing protein 3 n=1 Tax=Chaetomidium leptoderma TaxID=669021 RepID=A0AAN6ZW81_9PEZI|nr:kelch repeat-containing protein 3 [Chaetomidium leptoderma]